MAREPKPMEQRDDAPPESDDTSDQRWIDTQLLSDLFVNVVPIAMIAAFVLVFVLLPPVGDGGDPLLLFHGALIGGVVLVSIIAGWVISRENIELEGATARGCNRDEPEPRDGLQEK